MNKRMLQTKKIELQSIYSFDSNLLAAKRDLFTSDEKTLLGLNSDYFSKEESELAATLIEINEIQYQIDQIEILELLR